MEQISPAPTTPDTVALAALERAMACPNRDPSIEADLLAADRDGVEWYTRVRLRNAYVWQRHLDGDTQTPIRLLEQTVDETRGRGDLAEGLALCGLAASYSNQERTPEAIVAARRSIAVFRRIGAHAEAVRAEVMLACSLVTCEAWPLLDRSALAVLVELPRLPDRMRRWAQKHLQMIAMDECVTAELGIASYFVIESLERFLGEEAKSDEFRACIPLNRAAVLVNARRHADAEEIVEQALATDPAIPQIRAHLRFLRAQCLAARGELGRARAEALASVDELRGPRPDASNVRLRALAARAGALLLNEVGDSAAADTLFDVASSAVVARLREVEHAFAHVPELRGVTHDDTAFLAECREYAARSAERDLDVIRRAFERAARIGGDDLISRLASNPGPRSLCAWCGMVRTGDDTWLPIAEHLPPEDDVTHGICPACRSRLHAELDAAP